MHEHKIERKIVLCMCHCGDIVRWDSVVLPSGCETCNDVGTVREGPHSETSVPCPDCQGKKQDHGE
jgi:hypothetical protein